MYMIKIRTFLWFWKTFKVKRHWFETELNGIQIPPRLVLHTSNDDIIVLSNILLRDWGIYGIQGATGAGARSSSAISATTNDDQSVFQSDDAKRRELSQSSTANDAATG